MRSLLSRVTSKFKQKDIGDYTSGNQHKHGGHLWCNGVRYQPRDVSALIMYSEYAKQRIRDLEYNGISEETKEEIMKEYAEDLFEEFQQIVRFEEFQQIVRFEGKITLKDVTDILQIEE